MTTEAVLDVWAFTLGPVSVDCARLVLNNTPLASLQGVCSMAISAHTQRLDKYKVMITEYEKILFGRRKRTRWCDDFSDTLTMTDLARLNRQAFFRLLNA